MSLGCIGCGIIFFQAQCYCPSGHWVLGGGLGVHFLVVIGGHSRQLSSCLVMWRGWAPILWGTIGVAVAWCNCMGFGSNDTDAASPIVVVSISMFIFGTVVVIVLHLGGGVDGRGDLVEGWLHPHSE